MIKKKSDNAMKHAFTGMCDGIIHVSLKQRGDNLILKICDNGIGLPVDFTPETVKSYGMQLVQLFVKQLKGKLEVLREGGTTYLIDFKI